MMTSIPTLPDTMNAISILNPEGGSGELVYGTHPTPKPRRGEVLIRVSHAGVNRADVMQRQGKYPPPEGASPLPGLEVSGRIAALGEGVTQWKIGDAVCALLSGGGYAEYATTDAGWVMKIPDGWSFEEAAGFPEAIITVWMALHVEANIKKEDTLLLHGAASGIGLIATQFANHIGAQVITTASDARKCAVSLDVGASHSINYREEDFVSRVKSLTKNRGVDVVLDYIGGDYLNKNLSVIAQDGRMISLAFLRGAKVDDFNIAPMLLKRVMWKGTTLRSRSAEEKSLFVRDITHALSPALTAGYMRPRIDSIFKIGDAKKAHIRMEDNLNVGKIILAIE
ncbi:MAG: NAD(P)H-quinone oxidoreductase [Alphaproteobacteria bacterium]|nr:NAD(P)H-quinone oxidoreductase [Alphaproteobacteria bacterium]